ncbi:MAG TPA: DUF4932 domain-containing protein, partial [Prolixibacteraceae bacterium]|nr:DUF4932 domain-containing protein [Prolixibacteraceae bacterium]
MRLVFTLICWLLSCAAFSQQDNVYHFKTNSDVVKISLGKSSSNWRLGNSKKLELLELALDSAVQLHFISDIDSISFAININEEKLVYAILNKEDSFGVKIIGYKYVNSASFSPEYIKEHTGKVFMEIPEVQELVHIIIALTSTASLNPNLVEKNTTYYKDVMKWFGKYASHPTVLLIDSLLKENQYHNIKMNSCVFQFKGQQIVEGGVYERISFGKRNTIRPFLQQLQEFSTATRFRRFYKAHRAYYTSLLKAQHNYVNTKQMWEWLEKEFPDRYDSYKITFSPLVFGNHSTQRFDANGFRETVMFIAPPDTTAGWRKYVKGGLPGFEGELARIVFTEIDHNYVNPISDNYKEQIDVAFNNKAKWATEQAIANYRSTYAIFNEYMTWAVFALYLHDHYSKEDFDVINNNMNQLMKERGFLLFDTFSDKLLQLYISKA